MFIKRITSERPSKSSAERHNDPPCPYLMTNNGCALRGRCNYFHDKKEYERRRGKFSWNKIEHKIEAFDIKPILIGDSIWYQEKNNMIKYNHKTNKVTQRVPIPDEMDGWYSYHKYLDNIYMIDRKHGQIILFTPSNRKFQIKSKVINAFE